MTPYRESLGKADIKRLRSLARKKDREEAGLFLVEGEKAVSEALASEFEVVAVWRRDDIGEEQMARITCLTHPSPVLALVRMHTVGRPAGPDEMPQGLCLALDGVRDPGNFGTILRLADWFGIDTVYVSPECVDRYNPKTVQATMGALFRQRVVTTDLKALVRRTRTAGIPVYGTFLDGDNLYEKNLQREGLIVMGSEHDGIRPDLAAEISERLFIPPYPAGAETSESLNVAVATAILCAEFRRP